MAEFSKENPAAEEAKEPVSRNFIEQMIDKDLEEGVYETVHRIDTPFISGIVMCHVRHTINNRISHVHIWACHIDSGAQTGRTDCSLHPTISTRCMRALKS